MNDIAKTEVRTLISVVISFIFVNSGTYETTNKVVLYCLPAVAGDLHAADTAAVSR